MVNRHFPISLALAATALAVALSPLRAADAIQPAGERRVYQRVGEGGKYYALTVREADRFLASLDWLQGESTLLARISCTLAITRRPSAVGRPKKPLRV